MEDVIERFLSVSYDYGCGYGSGSGYGDSKGNGYGIGYGSGSEDGYGSGSDDSFVSGYGNGYGSDYGDGLMKYGEQIVHLVDGIRTLIYSIHGNYAKGAIVNSDLTLSPCFIAKEDDCFAHGETLQEAVEAVHAKVIQTLSEEERIDNFLQEYPDKSKKHSGIEFFNWHHILTGSCEMGRKQFCKDNNIDIDAEYTPMEFLNICEDAYGGDVIKQIIKKYN